MRIAVYVGSFNPVHKGHVKIARSIIKKQLADQVLIVPTGNYWDKHDLLAVSDRIFMWKFYQSEQIVIEEELNHIEKTYQLFRALKQRYPEDSLSLVLGADNITNFSRWVNYQELLEYPFIVIKRGDIGKRELKKLLKQLGQQNYTILDIPLIPISSSQIRENLQDYRQVSKMIDKPVYDYLKSKVE